LAEVAKQNNDLAYDLEASIKGTKPLSKINTAISRLAGRYIQESSALITLLDTLKIPLRSDGTKSKLRAVKAACKIMLQRGDLEAKHKRLDDLERQLTAVLLYAIRNSQLEEFGELRELVVRNRRDAMSIVRDLHTVLVGKINAIQLGIQRLEQGSSRIELGLNRVKQRQLNSLEQQ
jgi:hypothetical protein